MESVRLMISPENFDKAVHGGLPGPPFLKPGDVYESSPLPDGGDLSVYVKPGATVGGRAGAALTFTVQMPDGSFRRVQTVTTLANLEAIGAVARGWREGGQV